MSNTKYNKYATATRANFTPEELRRAQENFQYVKARFPKEHAESETLIVAKGLSGHREIHDWYARYKSPIPKERLNAIEQYADSTYAGAFGRGQALEAKPTTAGGTPQDNLYRPAIKPEGA
ncbi:hypothetical protein [Rhizobium laguerreae]|uniref:Uncharacterized protein n=1 Tax=Rhizobium laguerreae TaxID=1076926 RepID=A0AAX2QUL3_9HYPH|nr:hypothetical protein [Rhizobium laguerreae]TCU29925.1 hypothetical protein EV131_101411 [Rhizobium laguerreae]